MAEAVDGSFVVEGQTQIFTNIQNPSISGTIFVAFSIQSNDATTVQVSISDTTSSQPKLCIPLVFSKYKQYIHVDII